MKKERENVFLLRKRKLKQKATTAKHQTNKEEEDKEEEINMAGVDKEEEAETDTDLIEKKNKLTKRKFKKKLEKHKPNYPVAVTSKKA